MLLRLGASEESVLFQQSNLAVTYDNLGRHHESLRMSQVVYSGRLKLLGEEHESTLRAANNYASSLKDLSRFEEVKSLSRKVVPVARRILGDSNDATLRMRSMYAEALCRADGATLDDLREAVTTLEDTARIARRLMGGTHPVTAGIEEFLRNARAALAARETPTSK